MEKRGLIGHILVNLGHIKLEQVEEARRKQMAYPGLKLQERVRRLEREGT